MDTLKGGIHPAQRAAADVRASSNDRFVCSFRAMVRIASCGKKGRSTFRRGIPEFQSEFPGWCDRRQMGAQLQAVTPAGRAERVAGAVWFGRDGSRALRCAGRGIRGRWYSAVAARRSERPSRIRHSSDGLRVSLTLSSRCLRDPQHYEELSRGARQMASRFTMARHLPDIDDRVRASDGSDRRVKVLYFCEGYTDIRFVVGLSEMCELTMAIPERHLNESGLAARLADSAARVHVDAIKGGRLAFQSRSMLYLLSNIRSFDVVLSQEMGRGSLNATAAGKALGVPVVLYLGTSPVEYFRCRRLRRQVGPVRAWASETFLATSMRVTGALSSAVVTTGPYLKEMAERVASRVFEGYYCGIDTDLFKPVSPAERTRLRESLQFPPGKFVILFPSRISHEKDPETVLRATAKARERGLDAVVMNLGGGFHEFLACASRLGLRGCEEWVIGRPAVHPDEGSLRVHAGRRCRRAVVARRRRWHVAARGARMRDSSGGDAGGRYGVDASRHRAAHASRRCRRHGRCIPVGESEHGRRAGSRHCSGAHTSMPHGRAPGRSRRSHLR